MHDRTPTAGTLVALFVAHVASATLAHAQNGSATLDGVARAMGGKDRVLAVRTIVVEGTGDNFNLGQNLTPEAELPRFELTAFRRANDYPNKRWRIEQTREPRFLTGNTAPQQQRFGVDGDVAYTVGGDGSLTRLGASVAADRVLDLLQQPVGFLQAAFAPGASIREDAPQGQTQWVRIRTDGNAIAMLVDLSTMLPLRIQRIVDHPMLGDVINDWESADWRDVDGLKLPARVTVKLDGRWTLADMRLSSIKVDADAPELAVPAELHAQTPPGDPPVTVTVDEIAPGVWFLAGQTHHSVAIEMARSIVLVEAPQNDARTLAVIERARTLRPGKPVDVLINTHHHFDHSGGVRAAVSQGLTVVTHAGNREFYERTLYPRRHAIAPDTLARSPRPLRLLAVSDKYVRRDSVRTIEVYRVDGSRHSGSMLMVYLPADKLLIEADLFTPPAANATTVGPFPFAANLLDNIQRRGLDVERIVPIHGRVVPFSDLQSAAARAQ